MAPVAAPPVRLDDDELARRDIKLVQAGQLGLEAGGAPPLELAPVRQHPSLQQLFAWLKVQPDYALPAGMLGSHERLVAALGQLPSQAAARGLASTSTA